MLLNRAKLGRGLRPHDIASAEERVADHLLCVLKPLSAGILTNFYDGALEVAALGVITGELVWDAILSIPEP